MAQQQRTLNDIRQVRQAKLKELRELGYHPYPYRFEVTHHSADLQGLPDDQFPEGIAVAGRVVSLRRMGKASFAHLQDQTGRQQIYVKKDVVGEAIYQELFRRVDLGDFLGVQGDVFRTKTGEITVAAKTIELLAKSLRPLPNVKEKDGTFFDAFEDKENRYRRRHLDLIANPQVKDVFIKRARIIQLLRAHLDDNGFIEVETPALQPIYGGASARPFTTYHNALDQTLYLRIADELYLKRLIIGGFEKVYEIAKNFRNEGMDRNHNPEFTALEFYQAYADYHDTLAFTEDLFRSLATDLGSTSLTFQGQQIDLGPPFARLSLFELLKTHTGEDLSGVTEARDLLRFARERQLDVPDGLNYGQLLDKILAACSLSRDEVYILNVLKCRPPGNRNPTPEESNHCRRFLDRQLELIDPEYICCLGAVAAQNLLDTTEAIGRLRGKVHQYRGINVVCTYHPAYLLRNPAAKKQTWDDMKLLMRQLGTPVD